MLCITALMDNKPSGREGILAEHGLSFFVEYNGRRLLFDCGQSAGFLHNAALLNIDLKNLDCVVLSHGHYDHAGGYRYLIQAGLGSQQLYLGEGFFRKKVSRKDGGCKDLSAGFDRRFLEEWDIHCHTVTAVEQPFPGVYLLSGFPRIHDFETIPERFLCETGDGFVSDDFGDEICVALTLENGVALLVGCSHPGILNMVSHVQQVLGRPVRALFGGTHLVEADDRRMDTTVTRLKEMGVELLGMSHCSGDAADRALAAADLRGCHLAAGDSISLD